MNPKQDKMDPAGERLERLISRRLDGEITSVEASELDRILSADPAARALLIDSQDLDRLAAEALREDAGMSRKPTANRRYRGWWIAAGGAILTAAAVVALSFLPVLKPAGPRVADNNRSRFPIARGDPSPESGRPFMEYRNVDFRPRQWMGDVRRELIGIRGDDPDTLYIFERRMQATQIRPVSGDF